MLLPPILNRVKLSTSSALGNMLLNSEKFDISVCLTIRYHVSKGVDAYGCFLENSNNFLREIMCMIKSISHNEIYCNQHITTSATQKQPAGIYLEFAGLARQKQQILKRRLRPRLEKTIVFWPQLSE